ncbi:hypothetical protein GE061_017083 [Apolygus lucorum]|uniref:arylamine N-acetyltransferase n=1 Tax=Apolygus lucorum TaxID=248454 RepID=A0A8S9XM05_APOLU|nr:hypothetical protein GE061_017083 [Apolygus lucorum]
MMSNEDLELWLKLTGADKEVRIGDTPDLQLLRKLVKYQLKEVFYQNYDLLVTRKEFDLSPSALVRRMLVEGRRGMCFEACELMVLVLNAFKFDARRTPVFCTVNGQIYQEGAVLDHNVIVVYLDGKKYLIDIIFSFNSIREPLECSFEETEEKTVIPDVEKYRLEHRGDHVMVHMWLKGGWGQMYHIPFPLQHLTPEQYKENFRIFLTSPDVILIRDRIMKVGRVLETSRIGYTCSFDSRNRKGSGPYTMVSSVNLGLAVSEKISYEQFRDGLKKHFDMNIEESYFSP